VPVLELKLVGIGEVSHPQTLQLLFGFEPVENFCTLATEQIDNHEAVVNRFHPSEQLSIEAAAVFNPVLGHVAKATPSRGRLLWMKTDFKKTLDAYSAKSGQFRVLEVPPLQYLMVDGHGDPNTSPQFAAAVESLFPVAYALKFASKRELDRDYVVMPLEALWWSESMEVFTTARDKSAWDWTLMIMVPDWITLAMLGAAVAAVATKSKPARIDDVRLETLDEGRCVQTLHRGSFDDEGPTLERMHKEVILGEELAMTGRHHEIYFSDFRRVEPAKLRTILRQPVRRIERGKA
jgi:hypothetical protein